MDNFFDRLSLMHELMSGRSNTSRIIGTWKKDVSACQNSSDIIPSL